MIDEMKQELISHRNSLLILVYESLECFSHSKIRTHYDDVEEHHEDEILYNNLYNNSPHIPNISTTATTKKYKVDKMKVFLLPF